MTKSRTSISRRNDEIGVPLQNAVDPVLWTGSTALAIIYATSRSGRFKRTVNGERATIDASNTPQPYFLLTSITTTA